MHTKLFYLFRIYMHSIYKNNSICYIILYFFFNYYSTVLNTSTY